MKIFRLKPLALAVTLLGTCHAALGQDVCSGKGLSEPNYERAQKALCTGTPGALFDLIDKMFADGGASAAQNNPIGQHSRKVLREINRLETGENVRPEALAGVLTGEQAAPMRQLLRIHLVSAAFSRDEIARWCGTAPNAPDKDLVAAIEFAIRCGD